MVGDLLITLVLLLHFFSNGASVEEDDDRTMLFACCWANGCFFFIAGSFDIPISTGAAVLAVAVDEAALLMTFRNVSLDKLLNALFASPPLAPPMEDIMVSLFPVMLAVVAADG